MASKPVRSTVPKSGPVQVNLVEVWLKEQGRHETCTVGCHFCFITDYERDIFMRFKNNQKKNLNDASHHIL